MNLGSRGPAALGSQDRGVLYSNRCSSIVDSGLGVLGFQATALSAMPTFSSSSLMTPNCISRSSSSSI